MVYKKLYPKQGTAFFISSEFEWDNQVTGSNHSPKRDLCVNCSGLFKIKAGLSIRVITLCKTVLFKQAVIISSTVAKCGSYHDCETV